MGSELQNPYKQCPQFESGHFLFRLVRDEDAQDLLACYSDPKSAPNFNSDNCSCNFVFTTIEQMQWMIRVWLEEYARGAYVRFSVVDRTNERAIGTIECFAKPGDAGSFGTIGILRLDLASRYETREMIAEILEVIREDFFDCFGIHTMLTKAIPAAGERITALEDAGYVALGSHALTPYTDYYAGTR